MARPPFLAQGSYDPTHPSALALYCSDGRFTEAVEELLRSLGHPRLDTLTVPGGPGLFNVWVAGMTDSTSIAAAARFLIDAHKIRRVILVAHEGCGYYRQQLAGRDPDVVRRQQFDDLHLAARTIEGGWSGLRVDTYYARVEEGRVRFDVVRR
jgi:hypothetical protein